MNFTTKVPIAQYENPLDYGSRIVSLGSCFAENIGEKLDYFKFRITTNPFGIIFNPVSIEKLVERIVSQRLFTNHDIFHYNELWHCYEVHSSLSHPDKEVFLQRLNGLVQSAHREITAATHIIITYGTSWVYRYQSANEIVANCHKVEQKNFTKEILSPETVQQSIQNTVTLIQKINPDCQFIFTVSPVRHIKDGFSENQRSKAHLITAIHSLINTADHQKAIANYFASYEIMMDELRDYRFYAEDMLHPSQVAVEYIWLRFSGTYVAANCLDTMQEVGAIQKGIAHRPFNPDTTAHRQFLATLSERIARLQSQYPHVQF